MVSHHLFNLGLIDLNVSITNQRNRLDKILIKLKYILIENQSVLEDSFDLVDPNPKDLMFAVSIVLWVGLHDSLANFREFS
jgi:hypothetical protein